MQHIDRASFEDLDWLPFAIGVLAILALRTAVIGNVRTLIDLVVITGYVSVFAFARFVYKLYVFGHHLDQKAALRIPPFMPAVLGTKQIANFATESLPSWGSVYLAIFATGTAALALWHLVAGYRAAWRKPAAALLASSAIIAGGCGTSAMGPAPLDTAHATCAACRMGVADQTVASQIVVPGDDPRFFDDLGCLARYLAENPLPAGARVYVADHRTSAWLPADRAVYVRMPDMMAAMGSHVLAYDSAESVHLDPAAAGGSVVAHDAVFRGN
jgi:copper chaperone NosL